MPHILSRISPVPLKPPGRRNGRVASDSGIAAANAPPPDRSPIWSTEVTPRKQGVEEDSRLAEFFLGAFEAIDHGDHLQYRALKLPGLVDRPHQQFGEQRSPFGIEHNLLQIDEKLPDRPEIRRNSRPCNSDVRLLIERGLCLL